MRKGKRINLLSINSAHAQTEYTHSVSVRQIPVGHIDTLAFAKPIEEVVPLVVVPLLVGVVRRARPDLEAGTISVDTVRDVQTLVTVNANCAASKCPFLSVRARARLENDSGTVMVCGSGHAFVFGVFREIEVCFLNRLVDLLLLSDG